MSKEIIQERAESFIKEYLEHTGDRMDRISNKDLYSQYTEFTKFSMGKTKFNRLLMENGFMVAKAGGNVTTVFYIKSNWI